MLKPLQHVGQSARSSRRVVHPRETGQRRIVLNEHRRAECIGASEVAGGGVQRARMLELEASIGSGALRQIRRARSAASGEKSWHSIVHVRVASQWSYSIAVVS